MTPPAGSDAVRDMVFWQGDCLDRMREIADASVALIACDPPYHRVKADGWDRQWKTDADYLDWIGRLCGEWRRVLRPNGSLYCFASPRMAARVECKVGETFEVLNRITWRKPPFATKAEMFRKDDLRTFFPASEAIIFAEQYGSDLTALDQSGWAAECGRLHGFVFEPIRSYLDGERKRAGVRHREVIAHLGMTGHDSHFFSPVQWKLPLPDQYEAMRRLFNAAGGDCLRREYDDLRREYDDLRREYDDLRREYDDLRRPFAVSASVPYTDVWDFPTVPARPGKHPCEKPLVMMEHIVRASSRPGDLVLDSCMGSGTTGLACLNLGRRFVGVEKDPRYFAMARRNIDAARFATPLLTG